MAIDFRRPNDGFFLVKLYRITLISAAFFKSKGQITLYTEENSWFEKQTSSRIGNSMKNRRAKG